MYNALIFPKVIKSTNNDGRRKKTDLTDAMTTYHAHKHRPELVKLVEIDGQITKKTSYTLRQHHFQSCPNWNYLNYELWAMHF